MIKGLKTAFIFYGTLLAVVFIIVKCKKIPIDDGTFEYADHCSNGIQDGDEIGVDCGGSSCPGCMPSCSPANMTMSENGTVFTYHSVAGNISSSGSSVYLYNGNYSVHPVIELSGSIPAGNTELVITDQTNPLDATKAHFYLYNEFGGNTYHSTDGDGIIFISHLGSSAVFTFCNVNGYPLGQLKHYSGKITYP